MATCLCVKYEELYWNRQRTLAIGDVVQIVYVMCTRRLQIESAMDRTGVERNSICMEYARKFCIADAKSWQCTARVSDDCQYHLKGAQKSFQRM